MAEREEDVRLCVTSVVDSGKHKQYLIIGAYPPSQLFRSVLSTGCRSYDNNDTHLVSRSVFKLQSVKESLNVRWTGLEERLIYH